MWNETRHGKFSQVLFLFFCKSDYASLKTGSMFLPEPAAKIFKILVKQESLSCNQILVFVIWFPKTLNTYIYMRTERHKQDTHISFNHSQLIQEKPLAPSLSSHWFSYRTYNTSIVKSFHNCSMQNVGPKKLRPPLKTHGGIILLHFLKNHFSFCLQGLGAKGQLQHLTL